MADSAVDGLVVQRVLFNEGEQEEKQCRRTVGPRAGGDVGVGDPHPGVLGNRGVGSGDPTIGRGSTLLAAEQL